MKFGVYPHIRICVLMNMLYIIIRMMCSIYFCSVIKCKSWRFGWNYYGLSDENRPQIAEPKVRMLVCLLRRDSPILYMLAMVQGLFTYRHSGDLLLVRISLNPNGRVAPLLNSVVALRSQNLYCSRPVYLKTRRLLLMDVHNIGLLLASTKK